MNRQWIEECQRDSKDFDKGLLWGRPDVDREYIFVAMGLYESAFFVYPWSPGALSI